MNQKKSKRLIIILIIAVCILIILAGLAYAVLATDFMKSDKELFFKYATQIFEKDNGMIENELDQYYEKQKNTPYSNSGNFNVDISSSDQSFSSEIKNTNNMNITFSGQTDYAGEKVMQDISINYSDSVKMPLSFKKVKNIMGIQTEYVGSKYITIDNTKTLDSSGQESNISLNNTTKEMEKLTDIFDIEITEQEMNHIKNTYMGILNNNLQDSDFSKVNENNKKGYKLSLTSDKQKEILTKILENLKNDEITLNKLNELIKKQRNSNKITSDDIDDAIEAVDRSQDLKDISITVFQENKAISKVVIEKDEFKVSVEKVKIGNELQYNISLEIVENNEITSKIYFNIKYTGLDTLQNIGEDYELGLEYTISGNNEQTYSYKYKLKNEITFQETSNIGDFTEANSLNLNNLETEQRTNFINALTQRLTEVNEKQMKALGLSANENPIMNIIPKLSLYTNGLGLKDDELNQIEVSAFNAKFELYEGTNLGGGTVKGLLTTIAENNGINQEDEESSSNLSSNLIKEIHFNGEEYEVNEQTITMVKGEISTEDYFRVEFEKDENTGIIYRVVINKK